MKNRYHIVVASGVLCMGGDSDFLAAILKAKQAKERFRAQLPYSTVRVHMFYPNNQRIPSIELKAALRALADSTVFSAVSNRIAAAALRSGAVGADCGSAVAVGCDFRQASVVAPPDSPDLGNSVDSSMELVGV